MKSFKITQSITNRQDASLGIFLKELSKIPMATENEEIELCHKIQNGDEAAINRLIEANLRFVVSVAKQYQNKGIPLVDLIQIGSLGMREAALRWDESRGFKFISYAVWWVRQAIIQAISSQCRTIRVPMNQIVSMNQINKSTEKLEQQLGRNPSIEELEADMNVASSKINLTLSSINKAVSLDTPFKDEDAGCLLDVIPNGNSDYADNNLNNTSISEELEKVLMNLSNRESDILQMFFGLNMDQMTLEEISTRFGIGSERARQIIQEALEKLRANYKNDLIDLL